MENTVTQKSKRDIRSMVILALFTAIELLFCFTPLGSLPLGPGIVATLAHIPALIIALTMEKRHALYMGLLMGICSLIVWTFMPPNPLYAFAFSPFAPYGNFMSLIIAIVPRAVFPVFACALNDILKKKIKIVASAAISSIAASILHSVLVLGGIYIAFTGNPEITQYISDKVDPDAVQATLTGVSTNIAVFLTAWGGVNAIFEAVIAGLVSAAVIIPLNKIRNR